MQDEFKQAEKLLGKLPLPNDVFEQLDKLRETVPDKQKPLFDQFYEAAIAAQ